MYWQGTSPTLGEMQDGYKPDGYHEDRVRDWRFLWLRHKTVLTPYWCLRNIKLVETDYTHDR